MKNSVTLKVCFFLLLCCLPFIGSGRREDAQSALVLQKLRVLADAEDLFAGQYGSYGTIDDLIIRDLINGADYPDDAQVPYRYDSVVMANGYCAQAVARPGSGGKSLVLQNGEIRVFLPGTKWQCAQPSP